MTKENRYNAIFTDKAGKTTEWDFFADSTGDAGEKVNAEAVLQNMEDENRKHGAFPEIGDVVKIELWDYQAQEWFNWYL